MYTIDSVSLIVLHIHILILFTSIQRKTFYWQRKQGVMNWRTSGDVYILYTNKSWILSIIAEYSLNMTFSPGAIIPPGCYQNASKLDVAFHVDSESQKSFFTKILQSAVFIFRNRMKTIQEWEGILKLFCCSARLGKINNYIHGSMW